LDTGKVVTRLGLVWQERIRFVLTEQLELKRLQFLDALEEQASQAGDDAPALFDATATLMLGELRQLVADLIAALGGEAEKE
ncbi:recombination-associated protein RdgC, partial [Laribacter hongkongensis]|uniref:recombination-associated protein RdgC n=1 Tax=Laribacter hongkongensis TaxID=168471 RepID=UPI001878DC40